MSGDKGLAIRQAVELGQIRDRSGKLGVEGIRADSGKEHQHIMKGHREHEWSLCGEWCSLLGTLEVPSPGEGECAQDLPLTFPLGHLTGQANNILLSLSWMLSLGWGQAGSEELGLPYSPFPSAIISLSRWSQAP